MFYWYRVGSGRCAMGTKVGVKGVLAVQSREGKVVYGYREGSER